MTARPAGAAVRTVDDGTRVVVNFHGLGRPHRAVPEDERPYWCPEDRYLQILDEVVRQVDAGAARVEITFDDGNRSDVDIGLPALRERGLAATFFVCSDRIGDPLYLDAGDLAAMTAAGMRIGSHGAAHVDLRRAGPEELAREARAPQDVLSAASGQPVDRFAVPFGSYDRRVLRALRGFERVYSSDQFCARPGQRPLPRFSVMADWDAGHVARACDMRPSAAAWARHWLRVRAKGLR